MDSSYQQVSSDLLVGINWTELTYSEERRGWQIRDKFTHQTRAYINETLAMPVGKNLWTIPADDCSDLAQPQHRPLNLHLAVERPGNFCCDDGTCVDSELVCDNKVHCRDKTDERNCSLVVHKGSLH